MKTKDILRNTALTVLMLSISGCMGGSEDSKAKDEAINKQTIPTKQDTTSTSTEKEKNNPIVTTDTNNSMQTTIVPSKDENKTTSQTTDTTKSQITSLTLSSPKTNLLKDESIALSIKDKKGNDIKNSITWIVNPTNSIKPTNTNTITPIQDTSITLKAKHNNEISNPITISVKWIVNGHTLPPKPDEKINNSTLLGIDTNNNGVRDDVERWIYETYNHPIERGIFMQHSRAYQLQIVNPKEARQTIKYSNKLLSCESYWIYKSKKNDESFFLYPYRDTHKEISFIQFNTAKRFIAYDRYNREFHGEILEIPKASKNNCEFDNDGNLR